jgi:hypothetical protein
MATTGDVIQVSLKARNISNVVIRNVWYYRCTDAPGSDYLTGLSTDFQSTVLAPLAAIQPSDYVMESLTLLNIFNGDVLTDSTPTPAQGTRSVSGDRAPSFIAAEILLTRTNNRVRHGKKFISLPTESDIQGDAIVSGTLTLLNTLAATFDDVLFPGAVQHFTPVIVGRVPYTTPGGRAAYRLPGSIVEMDDNWSEVSSPRVVQRVTTMNSRKSWRGE